MKQQVGFTLLEVLVASLILFMSIALVSMAYKTGINAEKAAEKKVYKSVMLRFVQQAIAEELRVKPNDASGEGSWGDFSYQWMVVKTYEKWSKSGFDSESNSQVQLGRQLQLKDISIDVNGEIYEYTHLSWK